MRTAFGMDLAHEKKKKKRKFTVFIGVLFVLVSGT